MSEFLAYLQLGFDHITDTYGYDHLLFIVALCSVYTLADWKKVVILVTAFTLGHSATLALSVLGLVSTNAKLIELLIPLTIFITAILNFFQKGSKTVMASPKTYRYPMALVFGLIHGLGFSNYLRVLLGKEAEIINPLLGFNCGLELGQLLIVLIILAIAFVGINIFKIPRLTWNLALSGFVAGMAFSLLLNNPYFRELLGFHPI